MHQISKVAVMLAVCASQFVHAGGMDVQDKKTLAGHYYLEGATEVGSELLLRESGKFEWILMYGKANHSAQGTWQQNDGHVVLSAAAPAVMAFLLFEHHELRIEKEPKAGTWVAVVGVPSVGPVAQVEVRFEATSGKVATAVSDRNGDAIATMPPSERWARSGLRRAGTAEEWQWISVPAERAQARIAGFAITNPQSIQPAPFKTLTLREEKRGLAVDDSAAGFRGLYVKPQ